jgi:phosphoglycolate phosphatase-like HAD superfamily hydrolase
MALRGCSVIVNLVWDLDGTLFDTYPSFHQAFLAALNELGHAADPEWVMGLAKISLSHCAAVVAETYHLTQEEMLESFGRKYQAIPYQAQPPMPGARKLCEYVLSLGGLNVIVTHRRRQSTIGLLETHGLDALIADHITSDDGFPRKPDPEAVEVIMARNALSKETSILVGDRPLDVEAGEAAGVRTCLLGPEDGRSKPDYRVDDLPQLERIIREENEIRIDGPSA